MAQSAPHPSIPPRRHLRLVSPERPVEDPAGRRLRRGLLIIGLVSAGALGYLCLLVRVSAIDAVCCRLRAQRDEMHAVTAADSTELGAQSDLATNLDQAQRNGLRPVEGRDRVLVSPELCRRPTPPGEGADAKEETAPTVAAGTGAP